MKKREIIIVGGGMVGALSALLLAQQGMIIHLIEKNTVPTCQLDDEFDLRVSAFSAQSKCLLQKAGIWDNLPKARLCAYHGLQTWEKGSAKLTFDSQDLNLDCLGVMAENQLIQSALWRALEKLPNVHFYLQQQVININNNASSVCVSLDSGINISASLLIAADGANSSIRQKLNIPITAWDYRQKCLLISIKTDKAQQGVTWQEFRETGPCAFLPLAGPQASLVWYHSPEKINQLMTLSNPQLKQAILDEFPTLNFDFEVQNKGAFKLTRRHAKNYYRDSAVLVGDAAHSINPLAGQGVNLGFKDVQCLVDLLLAPHEGALSELLKRYEQERKTQNLLMQTAMDVFYKGSKSQLAPIRALRKSIFFIAQRSGSLKNKVMQYAMGL
ncbi:2-octaprenyl-3-methyl-6-methoxy-1,4-benzoquinol hydroxylase [Psychromonas sp. CNPT3]|uniref:FAD-dependent monooxygenase n=1 Tax=Psychromonas sp. CNPT3 TaxID=314282 RepID=UPI00006E9143|nr:FAD-dependent monooxygenase [Psychromonas sp. CNPT3]AGH81863.1 2-octaprenyl-3-methyl-6-methoxy-1,4-benzoquinol hydroxylase [Psychromonas sp. CNPT3]